MLINNNMHGLTTIYNKISYYCFTTPTSVFICYMKLINTIENIKQQIKKILIMELDNQEFLYTKAC